MNVGDLDFLRHARMADVDLRFGGGVRYASLDQTYNAQTRGDLTNGGVLSQQLNLSNRFQGAGLQAILEMRRGFGATGFSVYGNARGGILFGENWVDRSQSVHIVDATNTTTSFSAASRGSSASDSVPFVDLEAGVDWAYQYGNVVPFIRVGVVEQQWFGVGSPVTTANNKGGDLGLFGLQVSTGLNF